MTMTLEIAKEFEREIVQEIAGEEYALQMAFAAEKDEKRRIALANGWDTPVTKKVAACIPVCAPLSVFEMLITGYATDDEDLIMIAGQLMAEAGLAEAVRRREKATSMRQAKRQGLYPTPACQRRKNAKKKAADGVLYI